MRDGVVLGGDGGMQAIVEGLDPLVRRSEQIVEGWRAYVDGICSAQAHIVIACAAPAWGAADAHASQLFADVVGGGSSSRLFQQLREEQGLAYSVAAGAQNYADSGMFWSYVASDRADAGLVHREIERVIAEAAAGLEQRDLERARNLAKAG